MIDLMLWGGVAMLGFAAILSLGILLHGTPRTMLLVAACIPSLNGAFMIGRHFAWWEYGGFMGICPTIVLLAILVLAFLPWSGMDSA